MLVRYGFFVAVPSVQLMDPRPILRELCKLATDCKYNRVMVDQIDQQKMFKDIRFVLDNKKHASFDAQSLGNLMLAMANLRLDKNVLVRESIVENLLDAISKRLIPNYAQELSNILLGYARLGFTWQELKKDDIADNLLVSIFHIADHFDTRDIANTLRAFVKLKLSWKEPNIMQVVRSILVAINKNVKEFSAKEIASTLLDLANFGLTWQELRQEGVASHLLVAMHYNASQFNEQDVINVMLAFANLGLTWQELQKKNITTNLLQSIHQNKRQFDERHLANILWSCAMMQMSENEFNTQLSWLVNCLRPTTDYSVEWATQIKQAQLYFRFNLSNSMMVCLHQKLAEVDSYKSSMLHLNVADELSKLVPDKFENEVCIDGVLWVDILFPEKKLVVEVDGPYHLLPQNALKTHLLEKQGYQVVRISYQEWDHSNSEQRQALLETKVAARLNSPREATPPVCSFYRV